jgi:hypothetical protein
VAWLPPPELAVGVEPELKPPELEPEFVELEPVEPEPVELEPVEVEPELLDALVLCAEPGRVRASAPAVTTLAMVTAVVADRTLARPRSLAAWASRIPLSRRALLMSSSCGHVLVNPCTNPLAQL